MAFSFKRKNVCGLSALNTGRFIIYYFRLMIIYSGCVSTDFFNSFPEYDAYFYHFKVIYRYDLITKSTQNVFVLLTKKSISIFDFKH